MYRDIMNNVDNQSMTIGQFASRPSNIERDNVTLSLFHTTSQYNNNNHNIFFYKSMSEINYNIIICHLFSFLGVLACRGDVRRIRRSVEAIESISIRITTASGTISSLDVRCSIRKNDTRVRGYIFNRWNRKSAGGNTVAVHTDRFSYNVDCNHVGTRYRQQWRFMGPPSTLRAPERRSNGIG